MTKLDGLPLDAFEPGQEYELGNRLGSVFLAEGWGVPVPLDAPTPMVPFSPDDPYDPARLYRKRRRMSRAESTASPPRDRVADATRRRRKK